MTKIAAAPPFVSCIMPTANRRRFVPGTIAQFLGQDYPAAELIILDDGEDSINDLVPSHPALRYLRTSRHRTLGAKRNAACEAARGDIILHWDDDDWYAPHRIRTQVEALFARDADLCGVDRALFFDPRAPAAWEYVYPPGGTPWVCGATMCYRRTYWHAHPFADMNVGEDTRFAAAARPEQVCVLPDNRFFVALVHAANTSPKHVRDPRWQPHPVEAVRAIIGDSWPDFGAAPPESSSHRISVAMPQPAAAIRPYPDHPVVASRIVRPGVSVVIPHGGTERLPHLAASLANLRQYGGIEEIVVVDMGEAPVALPQAQRWDARYVFVRNDGAFERGRALNVGSALSTCELVLWKDNDLLMAGDFVETAVSELRRRNLDFLIPYQRIDYLSAADSTAIMEGLRNPMDCATVRTLMPGTQVSGGGGLVRTDFLRRYGGIPDGFRGWGGEDNAWAHKVALLGSSAISGNREQRLFHLYHARSGAHDATVHQQNPHYADNLRLLRRISSVRDRRQFLEQFPSFAARPWSDARRIVFVTPQVGDAQHDLAQLFAEGLRELLEIEVTTVTTANDADPLSTPTGLRPDAVVFFDVARGLRLLAQDDMAWLHDRTVIMVDTGMPADARHLERAGALCLAPPIGGGAAPSVPCFVLPANRAVAIDAGACLVQPLSIILGAPRLRTSQPGDSATQPIDGGRSMHHPVWIYWEGECPDWIAACRRTIQAHASDVRLLNRDGFERIRDRDSDIDIDRLQIAHRADFIRAFLLARYGGLWLDSDCIVTRSLTPLLDLLNTHDFVAHRDRQGLFPNGFLGARPASVIAAEFYWRICRILRSGQPLGWISLGGEPLTALLESTGVPWHELACELIQPVCWSQPEVFFAVADSENHARSFNDRAFCYMLSNTEIGKYAAARPGASLTRQGTFFRYLIDRATAGTAEMVTTGAAATPVTRIRAPDHVSPALARYRATKLAAEQTSFYLASVADVAPVNVLEVGIGLGRWGALLGGDDAAGLCVHGIELSPATVANPRHALYQEINHGDAEAPLNAEERHWDLLILTDPLRAWLLPVRDGLVIKAMAIADYVLIWDWCEIQQNTHRVAGASETWRDAVRASRIGTVQHCRYGAFLLSRADPREIAPRTAMEELFVKVFHENTKVRDESVSGPGSCLAQTTAIRHSLPHLLQSIGARSLLDAPCGDLNWMKHVVLGVDEYIGVDIVPDIIAENQRRHNSHRRRFIRADLTRDDLPDVDVVLCRDCLVHLSYGDIRRALANFRRSGSTHLLTTTFIRLQANVDIVTGDWRPLNLQLPPFNFPPPIRTVVEACTEAGGRYADKSLALWRLSDIG